MDTSNGMHTCLDKPHTYVRYVQSTSSAALRAQHLSALIAFSLCSSPQRGWAALHWLNGIEQLRPLHVSAPLGKAY